MQRAEGDDFLEEIESSIARSGVREIRNGGRSGPRDDGREEDANQNGTLDAVKHEEDGKNTAEEDTEPHSGALEDM